MASSTMSMQFHMWSLPRQNAGAKNGCKTKLRPTHSSAHCSLTLQPSASDPFVLEIAETLEDSISMSSLSSSLPSPLQKLRDKSSETLVSTPWPSKKDEPFRFTDISFIRQAEIYPTPTSPSGLPDISVDSSGPNLVIVDGRIIRSLSNLSELPDGVFVGGLSSLSSDIIMKRVSELVTNFKGDLFSLLNGVGAPDLIVVYVPAGYRLEKPLHLRYYSMEATDRRSKKLPISNPRVLVVVEEKGKIDIVEEYIGEDEKKCYWANVVTEVVVGIGAEVSHSYIQSQSLSAAHIKWTAVQQEAESTYRLVEVSTGGKLGRHNVHVQQKGPDTLTELSTLQLILDDQTQDLHSRLILDHPRGQSKQLHKCIVAHPLGQAVFDGNVKVSRYAQQTDAGQLTRSLLLEPRSTVNLKPNLQIIADDVKCSHGAAISDLDESQLFYFLTRGVDLETARKALILSFGAEIIGRLPHLPVRKKVESRIKELLQSTLRKT